MSSPGKTRAGLSHYSASNTVFLTKLTSIHGLLGAPLQSESYIKYDGNFSQWPTKTFRFFGVLSISWG